MFFSVYIQDEILSFPFLCPKIHCLYCSNKSAPVGGLIGFNSKTSPKILTTSNYELYKLFSATNNWVREIANIKVNESGKAYELTIAYYSMQGTPSINAEWGTNGKSSAIKFYRKGYDVFVFFNYDQGSPQKAIIQSSCGVELASNGAQPDESYTDVTPD